MGCSQQRLCRRPRLSPPPPSPTKTQPELCPQPHEAPAPGLAPSASDKRLPIRLPAPGCPGNASGPNSSFGGSDDLRLPPSTKLHQATPPSGSPRAATQPRPLVPGETFRPRLLM